MSNAVETQNISVLGLGLMGTALAKALLRAGHTVTVWNRTSEKAGPLKEVGAQCAGSAVEAINVADVTLMCVSNHAAVVEILNAIPQGTLEANKNLIQLSTTVPSEVSEFEGLTARHQLNCLEGSIFGTPNNVTDAKATIIVSGPREVFDESTAALEVFGDAKYLSSELGAVCEFDKVWFAYVYGLHAAFFQGAALSHAKGFALDAYLDMVKARTPILVEQCMSFGQKIATRNHPATMGHLDVWAEPFNETLEMCRALGVHDGLPNAIMDNFQRAHDAGRGDQELSAIFETLIGNEN